MIIFDREKLNYFILRILYLIVFIESRRNFCHVIFGDRQEDSYWKFPFNIFHAYFRTPFFQPPFPSHIFTSKKIYYFPNHMAITISIEKLFDSINDLSRITRFPVSSSIYPPVSPCAFLPSSSSLPSNRAGGQTREARLDFLARARNEIRGSR